MIDSKSWKVPSIFRIAQKAGKISDHEMYKTFNMGIGMVVILDSKQVKRAQKILKGFKLNSWLIGKILRGNGVHVI